MSTFASIDLGIDITDCTDCKSFRQLPINNTTLFEFVSNFRTTAPDEFKVIPKFIY